MNKLLGALAISAVLTGSTYANPFSDVPAGHWAYGAVNSVVNSGMMKGYPKGIFKGKETVNRYQMATIISRLLKRSGGSNDADVRRTLDRLGEEFMDELDLIGARLTALEGAFNEHVNEGGDANGFNFSGEARVRWENRTEDLTDADAKDDMSRFQVRTLVDIEKSVDRADVFVQLAHDKTFGDNVLLATDSDNTTEGNVSINQAYVNFGVTDSSSLKIGRQAFVRGNGSIIGRYDHLQDPYSYDGWVFSSSYDDISYDVWSLRLANAGIDRDIHGLDANFTDIWGGDLHVHYYHATGFEGNIDSTLDTYGFAWAREYEEWDFNVQYATQGGGTTAIDYEGTLLNLAVGYDLDEDDKLGLSWTSYSGSDANAAGNGEDAWQHADLSDAHNFLGFADVLAQQNVEDITFTWDRQVNDRNSFHLAYHMFSLENSTTGASLLGNGARGWAGVQTTDANGVEDALNQGTAANGVFDDDLGNELDLVWKHALSNDVSLALGYAAFDAGDYFTANNANGNSPDVTYTWLNATVKF